jgi:preprotein translocase SecE subunit
VARDRQRAKQRRRRRPSGGGPAAGSARTRPRDTGVEPAEAELEPTVAPEPTENATPDAEPVRMAEAGADEFEEAEIAQPTDPAVLEERAEARRPRRQRGRIITFLGHVIDELRRVQWPDRRQTAQGTAVTLGFVVVAGGFLGLMDALWKPLVDAII